MDAPEVHALNQRRARRKRVGGLPRWLELIIAVSPLITSISSIAIADQHGRIMEKLVEANSIPYLESGFSTPPPDSDEVPALDLLNRGYGPGHEESLRVTVDDRPVTSFVDLLAASLGPDQGQKA